MLSRVCVLVQRCSTPPRRCSSSSSDRGGVERAERGSLGLLLLPMRRGQYLLAGRERDDVVLVVVSRDLPQTNISCSGDANQSPTTARDPFFGWKIPYPPKMVVYSVLLYLLYANTCRNETLKVRADDFRIFTD